MDVEPRLDRVICDQQTAVKSAELAHHDDAMMHPRIVLPASMAVTGRGYISTSRSAGGPRATNGASPTTRAARTRIGTLMWHDRGPIFPRTRRIQETDSRLGGNDYPRNRATPLFTGTRPTRSDPGMILLPRLFV